MKTKAFRLKMAAVAAFSLMAIGLAAVSSVEAQRRRSWDGYPNWGGGYQLRETALNAGYNEGSKEGRTDRSRNRVRDFNEFTAYRNANKDYSSRLGDRDLYQRYFRLAFENGYKTENPNANYSNDRYQDRDRYRDRNDSRWGRDWNRYGQFGGSYEMRQTALNAGYNAGNKQGKDDARRGRHRDFSEFSQYRNASDDYNSKFGDRELYRRYYRQGFENGYEDGFRGY